MDEIIYRDELYYGGLKKIALTLGITVHQLKQIIFKFDFPTFYRYEKTYVKKEYYDMLYSYVFYSIIPNIKRSKTSRRLKWSWSCYGNERFERTCLIKEVENLEKKYNFIKKEYYKLKKNYQKNQRCKIKEIRIDTKEINRQLWLRRRKF